MQLTEAIGKELNSVMIGIRTGLEPSSPSGSMRSCLSAQLGSPSISSPELQVDAQPAVEDAANGWHDPSSDVRSQSEEDAASQRSAEDSSPLGQLSKKSMKNKKKKKVRKLHSDIWQSQPGPWCLAYAPSYALPTSLSHCNS